jgi:hypothetical protein
MIAAVFALAIASAAAPPPAPGQADIGPEPTLEEFAALAEAELARKLRKPQEVTFSWPYKLVAGPAGYYTCGRAEARKGKKGDVWVSAVVAHGQVVSTQWSTLNGMLAWDCKRHVRKGTLVAR